MSEPATSGDADDAARRTDASADQAAFPLGGIGTGTVALGARGDLRNWELFNRPSKDVDVPLAFFGVRADPADGEAVTRVLEAQRNPPHEHWFGYPMASTAGLPRLEGAEMVGEYPVAEIDFADDALPVEVSLTAYTPFVPLEPTDSGYPAAVLEYEVENPRSTPVSVSLLGALPNLSGYRGEAGLGEPFEATPTVGGGHNESRDGDGLAGVYFGTDRHDRADLRYSDFALAVLEDGPDEVARAPTWRGRSHQDAWETFRETGRLAADEAADPIPEGHLENGSTVAAVDLDPGETRTVTFLLTWFVPNRPRSWDQSVGLDEETDDGGCCDGDDCGGDGEDVPTAQNHYATRFDDAWDVARSLAADYDRLREKTMAFRDAFFGSAVPDVVLDAASSQIAVARSTSVMWFADGTVWGYEGCMADAGCCPGTCTHVWNYAQTMARLFPSLEREMRRIDLEHSTDDAGYQLFRTPMPLPDPDTDLRAAAESEGWVEYPAADGQFGTVLRLYREWTHSGDDEFLEDLWPAARASLDYAFEHDEWDPEETGVLRGAQHNTYDVEFHGANTLTGTYYLAALAAGAEMARAMGDDDAAERYDRVRRAGREALDEACWNGEYYEQDLADPDVEPHQYGAGCLSDQLIGQWYADSLGLDGVLPADHVDSALSAVVEHNHLDSVAAHHNAQRTYAINDEAGLLTCSWPRGGRPETPFPYCDEVFTGIEYQVAAHLIERGMVSDGLALVRDVRDRHDGVARNPWNEFECGNHYVRAMSSWSVYEALCGLSVDLTGRDAAVNEHGFAVDPVDEVADDFGCFWVTGEAWGTWDDGDVAVRHERGE